MREAAVIAFLQALGLHRDQLVVERGFVNSLCPLAPYLHAGGKDSRPSFGISVDDKKPSIYYCFGCSPQGRRLDWLLHFLFIGSKHYPYAAAAIYAREECWGEEQAKEDGIIEFEELPDEDENNIKRIRPIPPKVLRRYPLLQGRRNFETRKIRAWLVERGIPVFVQDLYRVRYDYDARAAVFSLTDSLGNIYLMRERVRSSKKIWSVSPKLAGYPEMEFPKLRDIGAWFGMELINWRLPVMCVEGEIDCMRLAALGFHNAIGSATSSVTDAQILSASQAPSLLMGYDNDRAGEHAIRRFKDVLEDSIPMYRVDWAQVDCKDAGDLKDTDQLKHILTRLNLIK